MTYDPHDTDADGVIEADVNNTTTAVSEQLSIPIYADDTNAPTETKYFNSNDGTLKYKDGGGIVYAASLQSHRHDGETITPSRLDSNRVTARRTHNPSRKSLELIGDPIHALNDYSGWTAAAGVLTEVTTTAYFGDTSLLCEDNSGSRVRADYNFATSADLSNCGICVPIRWDSPDTAGTVKILLFDSTGNRAWFNSSTITDGTDADKDWCMVEFGFEDELDGVTVDLANIDTLRINYNNGSGSTNVQFYVQAPMLVPYEQNQGGVVFTADDAVDTQYSEMLPILDKYGYSATAFIIKDNIGTAGSLTETQLDEMVDRGWLVSSHPQRTNSLIEMSDADAQTAIDEEYTYVSDRYGDPYARYMSWPYSDYDTTTIDQASQVHDMCFVGTGNAVGAWRQCAPYTALRMSFDSLTDLTTALDYAEKYNRLLIPQLHDFDSSSTTGGTNITPSDFEAFVDDVYSRNVDVVTVDQLHRMRMSTR